MGQEDWVRWLKNGAALKPLVADLGVPEPEAASDRLRPPDFRF
jgi:hypothetical protein